MPGFRASLYFGLAQSISLRPQFRRLKDAGGSDDAGDQFRWCDIESGVVRAAAHVGNPHILALPAPGDAPGAKNLALLALLDRNVETGFEFPVDGGQRNRHIERYAMPLREHSLSVGADFVRHLAGAAKRAVAADDHEVDLSA